MPDVGMFQRPNVLAPVPQSPPPPDPLEVAKQKLAKGDKLSPQEAKLILNSDVSSSDISSLKSKPYEVQPPAAVREASTASAPVPFKSLPLSQRPDNVRAGTEMLIPKNPSGVTADDLSKPMGGAPVAPAPVVQAPPPVVPIAPKPIAPVNGQAKPALPPGPVSSSVAQSSPVAEQAMQKPVAKEDIAQGVDQISKFLAQNPDGLTLGNILDAVGVAFSAKGGTQRQTMLQQQIAAQRQLAMQQALNAQQYGQQNAMQGREFEQQGKMADVNYANQLKLKQQDLEIEKQRAQMDLANAKDLNAQKAALDRVNKLIEIQALTEAEIKKMTPAFVKDATSKLQNWVSSVGGK